ncbi:MAG: hypothetical protein WAV20_23635 [Blastocatellia bacterium]
MKPVIGIFNSRSEAVRASEQLQSAGVPPDRINMLTPGTSEELQAVPTTETEPPGMGEAIGAVVGGAIGAAGGLSLGAAAASFLVPGVGPVLAVGLLGAALFGTGGAVAGAIAGDSFDETLAEGLPIDEMFVYEDALRQGRSIVIVLSNDNEHANLARKVLEQSGAESIDSARDNWWLGVRDAEEEQYRGMGRDFNGAELDYRNGFEAALRPQIRGRSYDEAVNYLMTHYPENYRGESFKTGYERGISYQKELSKKRKASA